MYKSSKIRGNLLIGNLLITFFISSIFGCTKPEISKEMKQGIGPIEGGDYYVATWGNDTNTGKFDSPWATWQKAFDVADAGDVVYFRGGVWYPTKYEPSGTGSVIRVRPDETGLNGEAGKPICFFNYPGETPILDCSLLNPFGNFNEAIYIQFGNFMHFKGLIIRNLYQRRAGVTVTGMVLDGCFNMTFENMIIHNLGGAAIHFYDQFRQHHLQIASDTTKFINCDIYNVCDSLCLNSSKPCDTQLGGRADGIFYWGMPGAYVLIEGCRMWKCSDNGIDCSGAALIEIRNNWVFSGNYPEYGEGSGIKYGHLRVNIDDVTRKVYNNISAFNKAIGFDENNSGGLTNFNQNNEVYNNTAYRNNIGYTNFSDNDADHPVGVNKYYNNISYIHTYQPAPMTPGYVDYSHNSWRVNSYDPDYHDDYGSGGQGYIFPLTDADFVSLNPRELTKPRKPDGSLPDINFLKLKDDSELRGQGRDVGMSKNPDIGIDWDFLKSGRK